MFGQIIYVDTQYESIGNYYWPRGHQHKTINNKQ